MLSMYTIVLPKCIITINQANVGKYTIHDVSIDAIYTEWNEKEGLQAQPKPLFLGHFLWNAAMCE